MLIIHSKLGYAYAGFLNGYHLFEKSGHSNVTGIGSDSISEIMFVRSAKYIVDSDYVYICKGDGAIEPSYSTSRKHTDSIEVLTSHSVSIDVEELFHLV